VTGVRVQGEELEPLQGVVTRIPGDSLVMTELGSAVQGPSVTTLRGILTYLCFLGGSSSSNVCPDGQTVGSCPEESPRGACSKPPWLLGRKPSCCPVRCLNRQMSMLLNAMET